MAGGCRRGRPGEGARGRAPYSAAVPVRRRWVASSSPGRRQHQRRRNARCSHEPNNSHASGALGPPSIQSGVPRVKPHMVGHQGSTKKTAPRKLRSQDPSFPPPPPPFIPFCSRSSGGESPRCWRVLSTSPRTSIITAALASFLVGEYYSTWPTCDTNSTLTSK